LERRVTALEQRMDDVHTLAAGVSAETGDLKAVLQNHINVLNGWGTQLNARLDGELGEVRVRLDSIDRRLDGHDRKFGTLRAGQEQILVLLNQLIADAGDQPS
jgi:hypothetical protein